MADSSVRWRVGTAVLVAALLSLIGLWWGPPRLAEAVAGEWMRELPPNDSFPRVAVDATGMYIFGRVDWDPNAFDRVFTSRYALDGTPSWRIETTDMRHMGAAAITTHEGTVYTVYSHYSHLPAGAPMEGPPTVRVQQRNANGTILWSRDLPAGEDGRLNVRQMVADASGVYLLGVHRSEGNESSILTKLSFLNGSKLWTRVLTDEYPWLPRPLGSHDGQVYLLTQNEDGYEVLRFDADGNETWQPPLELTWHDVANSTPSLAVASSGVYVFGHTSMPSGTNRFARVSRFDLNKQRIWQRDFLPAEGESAEDDLLADATGFLLHWQKGLTPDGQNAVVFRKYDADGAAVGEGTFSPSFYQWAGETAVFGGAVYMSGEHSAAQSPAIRVVARVIPTTGLKGKVTWSDAYPDRVGQGVQGATVKVGNQTFTTDAQGEYEVTSDLVGQDATVTLPIFEHGNAQAMMDQDGALLFGKAPLEAPAAAPGTSNISLTINEQIKLTIDPNTGKLKTTATFGKNVQLKGFGQSFNLTNLRLSDQGVQMVGGTAQLAFKYDANSPPISLNVTLNYVKASDELTITGVAGSTFQWGGQTATLSKFEIKSSPAVNTATIEASIALKLSNVPITATLKGTGTAQGVVLTAVGTAVIQGITLTFDPITVENGQFRVKGRVKLPNQPVELAFDTTTGLNAPRLILPLPQFTWDGQTLPLRLELLGNAMILAGEGNVQIGGQAVALKVDTQFNALSLQSTTVRVEAVIPLPEGGEATAKLEYNPAQPQNSSVTGTLKVFLALCPGQKTDFNVDVRASAASIKLGFRTQIPVDCDGNGTSTLVDINGDFDGQLAQLRVSWPVTVGNSTGRVSATVKSDGTFFQIMFNVELKFGPGAPGASSAPANARPNSANAPRPDISTAAASDVRVLLTDGVGRRTGFDPATGQIVNEIPGGSWTGLVNGMDTFTMPGRIGGYAVTLFSQTQQQATLVMTVGGQTKTFTTAVGPNVPTTLAAETIPQDGGVVIQIGPAAVGCAPRPPVRISPAPGTPGALLATFTAASGSSVATNAIREIRIGQAVNGVVDANGRTGLGAGSVISFSSPVTSATLTVRRVTPGQATTVPLTIVDGCGEWQTFVGGGAGAF